MYELRGQVSRIMSSWTGPRRMALKLPGKIAFTAMVNTAPNGTQPAFRFRVFVADLDGSNLKRIDLVDECDHPATSAGEPEWSADKGFLEYTISRYSPTEKLYAPTRYKVSLSDGTQTPTEGRPPFDPLNYPWNSPDGKYAFLLWDFEDNNAGFTLAKPDGGDENYCAVNLFHVHGATWLQDSSAILFCASSDEPNWIDNISLFLFELSSRKSLHLLNRPSVDDANRWSSDLQFLVCGGAARNEKYCQGFYLLSRDGTLSKHLADLVDATGVLRLSQPSWSADDRYFAISCLLSEVSYDYSVLIFDRQGELITTLCWPGENFTRIDDIALNLY